jgi:hypothetical protein
MKIIYETTCAAPAGFGNPAGLALDRHIQSEQKGKLFLSESLWKSLLKNLNI